MSRIITTLPFRKGPPECHYLCRHSLFIEQIAAQMGKKLKACIDHSAPFTYVITCGTDEVGEDMLRLLKRRGLDPKAMARKDWRDKGRKHRRDPQGDGPIVYGVIPVDYLELAETMLGPKYKPGVVVAHAQTALTDAETLGMFARNLTNEHVPQ